jgi:hypothetical protein
MFFRIKGLHAMPLIADSCFGRLPRRLLCMLITAAAFCWAQPGFASDHADPIMLRHSEAGLTGLFLFPDGDRMVFILGIRPRLTQSPPFELEDYEYSIMIDLHTGLGFDNEQDRLRYGGTIQDSTTIAPDITMSFKLNNDTSVREQTINGLHSTDGIRIWSGVRDDPFINPRFFGTNIIAIVASVPRALFPAQQQDWIVWGKSTRNGRQIDHVGRSNRTMLPRFNVLNTLPPSEHVARLKRRHDDPNIFENFDMIRISPLFGMRPYDFAADVMIYSTRFPAGYPNGRLLTDDVTLLTCQMGDCLLMEIAFTDSPEWPRRTVNDKEFLPEFPYLAEPWPDKPPAEAPHFTVKNRVLVGSIVAGLLIALILPWILLWRCRRLHKPSSRH